GQVVVSVAATLCATALYGHLVSHPSLQTQQQSLRLDGGVIESRNVAYYPEHLAALDSLSRFHALSVQRTAELAGELRGSQVASLADAARRHPEPGMEGPSSARRAVLGQVTVLPPRRPAIVAAVAAASAAPAALSAAPPEPAPQATKIWGVELPRFVPTGAAVMDKLASVKDRIGGLIHVSSR
ncbi:MAG: hypothetical protein JO229_01925, partial [Alphaproteobacteria bacterium]|nr:hypothetical protein [Alphaproteobacteria bacterium]